MIGLPFFRCVSCEKLKFKSKDVYEVQLRGTGYNVSYWLCVPCGSDTEEAIDRERKSFQVRDSD